MTLTLIVVLQLVIIYLFAVRGRHDKKELENLKGFHYAHRGLHGKGLPENSMSAFKNALDNGYGIELDVHLLKDGNLAVIHDSSLKRTTGMKGYIEALTAEEIKNYFLGGTSQTIPSLKEVLDLFNGKAPMIIELKATRNNHKQLVKAVCDVLENYNGDYCIESFDPRCLMYLKKYRPDIIRGQLSQNFFKSNEKLSFVIKFLLTHNLLNFLSTPDFIAYKFNDRNN